MSGVLGRTPAPATAGAPPASAGSARTAAAVTRDSLAMRLVAFAALAAFGAAHWGLLVKDPPVGRTLLVLLVATGGAAALGLLSRAPLPRPALHALAAVIGLAMLALGLMAAGLPGRLLLPAHWSELADGLDRGLAGMQDVEWPYDGPDTWIRRAVLLGVPAVITVAALFAFWPARRGVAALRLAGLVALLILYGTPVTEHDPGAPALRGIVLLLLIGAWLWLPRMPRREAAIGAAVVASVGVLSLPVAVALNGDRAWWDYGAWSLFGKGEVITFNWTHEYGPLDWSRAGATVLNVKSDRPHYWKAEALDSFDGLRWVRSVAADDNRYGPEVAFSGSVPEGRWDYNEYNPSWDERIRFTVRSLSSTMVVGAGITMRVDGVGGARPSSDGTTRLRPGVTLEKGDTYFVRAYAPNPTKAQMEGVQEGYPGGLIAYTSVKLPNPGETATSGPQRADAREHAALGRDNVFVPLRGDPASGWGARAEAAIRRSPYERMYDLTQTLTAGPADGLRGRQERRALPAGHVHLLRAGAHTTNPADGLPLRGQAGLLPAVLWRHGPHAADGWHSRPRGRGLLPGVVQQGHRRVPRPRSRRAFLGGGLVHRYRLGPVRPHSGALAGAVAVQRSRHERSCRRRGRGAPAPGRGGLGSRDGLGRRTGIRRRKRLARAAASAAAGGAARGGGVPHRKSHEPPSQTRTGRARRGPALGAPARARAAGLGRAQRRPRCWDSSGGSGASRVRRRRPMQGACAGTATTRACRRRQAWASAGRCAGS